MQIFECIVGMFRRGASLCIRPAHWRRRRYVRALEEEIARLRGENRALINSILGVAGIPPMRAAVAAHSTGSNKTVAATLGSPGRGKTRPYEKGVGSTEAGAHTQRCSANVSGQCQQGETGRELQTAAPLRRRSWKQIGRALEIEDAHAAQRERESDTETFPTPRNVVRRSQ